MRFREGSGFGNKNSAMQMSSSLPKFQSSQQSFELNFLVSVSRLAEHGLMFNSDLSIGSHPSSGSDTADLKRGSKKRFREGQTFRKLTESREGWGTSWLPWMSVILVVCCRNAKFSLCQCHDQANSFILWGHPKSTLGS